MANRTEGFTFTRTKYPWNEWTDGSQWRIYKGEDYRLSTYNMQISIHGRARKQKLKVKTNAFTEHVRDNHGWVTTREGLVFQFYKEKSSEPQSSEAS